MREVCYRVRDFAGVVVMTTTRQQEAFIRARQIKGVANAVCPRCGEELSIVDSWPHVSACEEAQVDGLHLPTGAE